VSGPALAAIQVHLLAAVVAVEVAVVGVGVVAVGWYARNTYYVGLDGDRIAIFKGRPGGLLWFEPTLQKPTPLTTKDVVASSLPDLRAGHLEPTKADADRYVKLLTEQAEAVVPAPVPTTVFSPPTTTSLTPPTTRL